MNTKHSHIIEYGDFQTPLPLAAEVCDFVATLSVNRRPFRTVIEPTCGVGNFLRAVLENAVANSIECVVGRDINSDHVRTARDHLSPYQSRNLRIDVQVRDFFQEDWQSVIEALPQPILFIGNPPWVTNSQLGQITGENLPRKKNFKQHSGLDAMTGKGNFDISESMLAQLVNEISATDSVLAFLVKTSVARKLFEYAQQKRLSVSLQIRRIDAATHFGVSADACLVYAEGIAEVKREAECPVYDSLTSESPTHHIGLANGRLVSNVRRYHKWQTLDAKSQFVWRSGIKHDCAKVMELKRLRSGFWNGFGERVPISEEYVYPLLKSSDIANGRTTSERWLIVPQRRVGEPTSPIELLSPTTWSYLNLHATLFRQRKSRIYCNAPPFAVFGVGDYTFKPWKVSISGLYKDFRFCVIPPQDSKPVVFDDTCYFLGFDTEEEATFVCDILSSEPVAEFLESIVFKDDKRPITASVLNRIDVGVAACLRKDKSRFDALVTRTQTKQPRLALVAE
ncbi:MAG: hypothetical protein ACRC46_01175 [Thermoguttaceae bacterium]